MEELIQILRGHETITDKILISYYYYTIYVNFGL